MKRKGNSATEIGNSAGMSARDVNRELEKLGYQERKYNQYCLTEKGKQHSTEVYKARGNTLFGFNVWDDEATNDVLKHNQDKVRAHKKLMEQARKILEGFDS